MIQIASKADDLYHHLREEIGQRTHGDRFWTIREIMSRYGLSQSVVDRTLSRLRLEGWLVTSRGKGVFVGTANNISEPVEAGQLLLLLPNWGSCDISILGQLAASINEEKQRPVIRVESFDVGTAIPRNLDVSLRKASGMVILPASGDFVKGDYDTLFHYGEIGPTVLLGRYLDCFEVGSVILDDSAAAELAIHHLAAHGHRRIGVLINEPHNKTILDRVRGAENYARLHNLELDMIDCEIASGELSQPKTFDKFNEVIKHGFAFTALLGVSGESTLGAVNACRNAGIGIPGELSVVAVAGEEFTRTGSPPVDTVGSDIGGQFRMAGQLINQYRPGQALGHTYLQPRLIQHGSVGLPGEIRKP